MPVTSVNSIVEPVYFNQSKSDSDSLRAPRINEDTFYAVFEVDEEESEFFPNVRFVEHRSNRKIIRRT